MKKTVLPDATREEMLAAAGLDGSARWAEREEIDGDLDEEFGMAGWHIVDADSGDRGGMTAHRTVLHPDEYVDPDALQAMIERQLGFTYEEVSSVYDIDGRPSANTLQLRAQIDARLLELSRSGGNMLELAKALDWHVDGGGEDGGESCRKMERALARAREAS